MVLKPFTLSINPNPFLFLFPRLLPRPHGRVGRIHPYSNLDGNCMLKCDVMGSQKKGKVTHTLRWNYTSGKAKITCCRARATVGLYSRAPEYISTGMICPKMFCTVGELSFSCSLFFLFLQTAKRGIDISGTAKVRCYRSVSLAKTQTKDPSTRARHWAAIHACFVARCRERWALSLEPRRRFPSDYDLERAAPGREISMYVSFLAYARGDGYEKGLLCALGDIMFCVV